MLQSYFVELNPALKKKEYHNSLSVKKYFVILFYFVI